MRVALVGLGMMGRNHARVLTSDSSVDFVGVFDEGIQHQETSPYVLFTSLEKLIQSRPDYCVVSSPTSTHENIAVALIESGIPVLIEKPLSYDFASATRIVNASEKYDVKVGVGHIERFNPAVIQLFQKLSEGMLGDVYQIATRRQGPFPQRISDVGVAKDLATHDIDIVRYVSGTDYQSLCAFTKNRNSSSNEDFLSVVGQLNSGTLINHIVNWMSPLKERKIIVTGENGTFVVDTLRSDLAFYANGKSKVMQTQLQHFSGVTQGDITYFAFDKIEPLVTEHRNFQDYINGKSSDVVTASSGAQVVRIADEMIRSATVGMSLTL